MKNLIVAQLPISFEEFKSSHPSEMPVWVRELQDSLAPLQRPMNRNLSSTGRPGDRARKAIILVNGLWELGSRRVASLARVSHMHLLASLIRELDRQNVESILLDFRHPVRLALYGNPPRMFATGPPCTMEALSGEARNGYRITVDSLLGSPSAAYETHVVEPTSGSMLVRDLVAEARNYLESLEMKANDIIFVAGGILSPYLVETVLPAIPGRKYFYCMSYPNVSLRPDVYSAVLTPVPNKPMMPTLPTYERPGGLSGLRLSTTTPPSPLATFARRAAWGSASRNIVVAIGLTIGDQMDDEYVDLLTRIHAQVGSLELVVVGESVGIAPRLREALDRQHIGIRELGMVTDIGATLSEFCGARAVVVNPRHPGNGGSLVQASLSGLPIAVFSGNDAEIALPPSNFHESVTGISDRVTDLLQSKRFRLRALREVKERRARQDRDSAKIVEKLVSADATN